MRGSGRKLRRAWPAIIPILALLLSACGPDGTGATGSSSTQGPVATNATVAGGSGGSAAGGSATTAEDANCPFSGIKTPTQDVSNQGKANLSKVSPTQQGCIDTIAFEFSTFPPSWSVSYLPGPFTDAASGAAVSVPGPTTLVVSFADTTYSGSKPPGKISSKLTYVKDITYAAGPNGALQFIISLDSQLQYQTSISNVPSNFTLSIA